MISIWLRSFPIRYFYWGTFTKVTNILLSLTLKSNYSKNREILLIVGKSIMTKARVERMRKDWKNNLVQNQIIRTFAFINKERL
ncbi:hypothetical protein AGMMS49574_06450 [Bacteroidia bacterium]|nr:hypothetical protein AGMMS49574_06450 [Bacteroidia bacterium]GHU54650.1 hypothetical protein FACS189411_01650 [Bacteroidia bacterium]